MKKKKSIKRKLTFAGFIEEPFFEKVQKSDGTPRALMYVNYPFNSNTDIIFGIGKTSEFENDIKVKVTVDVKIERV